MRICFICKESVRTFSQKRFGETEQAQLYLFGFNGINELSYEKELKGETGFVEEIALLSKTQKSLVISGCKTDALGHKRDSAVIAERGKVVGVSDAIYAIDGNHSAGATLHVYETELGKMGVVVGEDLFFPETVRALALCGAEYILCPFGKIQTALPKTLLQATAYYNGVPILFCGEGYCTVVDGDGEILFASADEKSICSFEPSKEYHLIETRRKGKFRL